MASGMKWLAFAVFVLATAAQLTSILSSYMVTNPYSAYFHDGLFYRCGAVQHLEVARAKVVAMFGSEQIHVFDHYPISQQHLDSILSRKEETTWFRPRPSICYWWNHNTFSTDKSNFEIFNYQGFILFLFPE